MKANHTNKTYAAAMQRTSFVSGLMAPICSELTDVWTKVQLRVEVPESPGAVRLDDPTRIPRPHSGRVVPADFELIAASVTAPRRETVRNGVSGRA